MTQENYKAPHNDASENNLSGTWVDNSNFVVEVKGDTVTCSDASCGWTIGLIEVRSGTNLGQATFTGTDGVKTTLGFESNDDWTQLTWYQGSDKSNPTGVVWNKQV